MKQDEGKEMQGRTWKKGPGSKRVSIKQNKELYTTLLNARVVQPDLVYVIGLSPMITSTAVSRSTRADLAEGGVLRPVRRDPEAGC